MTETTAAPDIRAAQAARLRRRRREERRFRAYGVAAISIAIAFLALLLVSIAAQAAPAFTRHMIKFDLTLAPETVAPEGRTSALDVSENVGGFNTLVRDALLARFPEAGETRALRLELFGLTTRLAVLPVARQVAETPSLIGMDVPFDIALSDDLDLYLKGLASDETRLRASAPVEVSREPGGLVRLRFEPGAFERLADAAAWPGESYGDGDRSVLLQAGPLVLRALRLSGGAVDADILTGEGPGLAERLKSGLSVRAIHTPESERNVTDRQVAWTLALKAEGRVERAFNAALFANADSTYPEIAGALAAIIGSLLTMLVTAALALPVGVMAAIYLEEYAPKTRLTALIEVNINNLAAVPSIVFGLLGAAVFLNFFGLPRSAPLVGGLVLSLMTLPTVIIASRAALKAVPPSIREAALGVGASKTQAVMDHVLPLAAPGMLTGSIIGMARALGETAPLLLIGMVAFVAEPPSGITDEATALPVLIFKWSTGAERAWEPNTAAAIIILLVFMVAMNAAAVLLRRRLERRW